MGPKPEEDLTEALDEALGLSGPWTRDLEPDLEPHLTEAAFEQALDQSFGLGGCLGAGC